MHDLKIEYPVYTIDGRELVPAGTLLSDDTIRELASLGNEKIQTGLLLEFGTIKSDLLEYISQENYQSLFDDRDTREKLIRKMLKASFPLSVLESIYSFKEYDLYTYRHLLMVFALSTLLSESLVKEEYLISDNIISAPTHDLGKKFVPVEILNKSTPLTPDERRRLDQHTLIGHVLLSHYFRDPSNITARVARDHHERRDGSGYPAGKKIDDIMIEFVIVTDIYDALISPRPYRPSSYDKRTALEEITLMAEKGKVSWVVVKALINQNRKISNGVNDCMVSTEKRGVSPRDNLYGVTTGNESGKN